MINEGKIGVQEAICIATLSIGNKITLSPFAYITQSTGTAGWLLQLISCASAIVLFTLVYLLLKDFPGKNIVQIYDLVLGRFVGFIFSVILMVAFLAFPGSIIRDLVDTMKVYEFGNTPESILTISLIAVAFVAVYLGLETIARTAKLFAFFALGLFILLLLLSSQNFRFAHISPIFGYGLDRLIPEGIINSSTYADIMLLSVFTGSLQGISHFKKTGYLSLLYSGLIISAGFLSYTLAFGYTTTQEITSLTYELARIIQFGNFFQRLDPLFLFLWFTSTSIHISILFYCAVSIYCKMFRLQDTKPVIIPLAIILYTIATFQKSSPDIIINYVTTVRTYGSIPFFGLPLVALIVAKFRKKRNPCI